MWMDIMILGHLLRAPAHGYEIKQRLGRTVGYTQTLNNNVLYPALRRFEEMGAVTSELVAQASTPPRRVYRVTETGLDVLRGMLEEFPPEMASSEPEFNVRLAYFHLLEPDARLEILERRATFLRRLLDHLSGPFPEEEVAAHPYGPRLIRLLQERHRAEMRFLEELAVEARGE